MNKVLSVSSTGGKDLMMQFTRPKTDLAKFPLVFIRVGLRAEQRRNIRYRKHYSNPPASHRSWFPNRRLTDKSLLLFVPAGVGECSSVNFKANILHRKSHCCACNIAIGGHNALHK